MKKKTILIDLLVYVFLIIILLFVLLPLVYTIFGAFKSNMEIMAHPEALIPIQFTMENFEKAFDGQDFNILRMLWNSMYYTFFSVIITLGVSVTTGYVFARGGDFKGNKVIFALFSSLMFINMGSITIYPTFQVLKIFHLSTSLWGLIVKKFFAIGIVNIYLVRSFIRTIPIELDEAATLDGCGFLGTFIRVIFPLLKPVVATLAILAFQSAWNEYLMPTLFTITKPEQRTLISGIMALKGSDGGATGWGIMLAGATISLIPILIVYAFLNKYFVDGIAAGAVKG